jgi:hypothetical protein
LLPRHEQHEANEARRKRAVTPQEEKDLLLRVAVRIAQTQLEKGGIIPFGATLGKGRDVQLLIPNSAKGNMTIEIVDAYWRKQMARAIEAGNVKALCTVADVRVTDTQGKLVPGVFIHIEHFAGVAEELLYHYAKDENAAITFLEVKREATIPQYFASLPDPSRN